MTKFLDRLQEMKLKMASLPLNTFVLGTFIILIISQIGYKLSDTILSILLTGAISIVSSLLSNKDVKETHNDTITNNDMYSTPNTTIPTDINVTIKK